MLQSRLRPLPRRQGQEPSSSTSAPAPEFHDHDNNEIDEDPEDLFSSFLPHLFPDDAPSFHGNPGQHLLYASPRYGDLEIMVPSYPGESENKAKEIAAGNEVSEVDQGRKLFAHFLWSAAMVVAEGVEKADAGLDDEGFWKVKGESVLELGAGAGLPSLISALAQASNVTVSDHPSSPAFTGSLNFNVNHNITPNHTSTSVSIQPHEWGVLDDTFALENKARFSRIIAADCYWMRSQHDNLVRTMLWFLSEDPNAAVWVVAGFHTGRTIVAGFFETAVKGGLVIEKIFERDLMSASEDGREVRREWMPEREGEGVENRKRWCVVALLRRAA